jgi:hypothetical protein
VHATTHDARPGIGQIGAPHRPRLVRRAHAIARVEADARRASVRIAMA